MIIFVIYKRGQLRRNGFPDRSPAIDEHSQPRNHEQDRISSRIPASDIVVPFVSTITDQARLVPIPIFADLTPTLLPVWTNLEPDSSVHHG